MSNIGEELRDARIKKGYTLDDLQQITKIQKRYLIAIEEEKFDELPGDFYVRAFIKQYADTVGLDGNELLEQYQENVPQTDPQKYVDQSVSEQTRTSKATTNTWWFRLEQRLPQIIIVFLVVVLIGAIYAFMLHKRSENKPTIPDNGAKVTVSTNASAKKRESISRAKASSSKMAASAKKKSSTSTKKLAVKQTAKSGNTQAYTITNLPTDKDSQLVISAKNNGSAWITVTLDDATSATYTGEVTTSASHTVTIPKATKKIVLTSGNLANTGLKLNETDVALTADSTANSSEKTTITFSVK
ncbi:helix-turn-helix domain-containing protein [Lactobacillus selangorensis]|nr:helix-turn-helix domain-containing protein [Lactobacillus selangorensis]